MGAHLNSGPGRRRWRINNGEGKQALPTMNVGTTEGRRMGLWPCLGGAVDGTDSRHSYTARRGSSSPRIHLRHVN
jgi:hypothetical protein